MHRKRSRRNAHQIARSLHSKNIVEIHRGMDRRYECLVCRGEWRQRRYAERHACKPAVPTVCGPQRFNTAADDAGGWSAGVSNTDSPRCCQPGLADISVRLASSPSPGPCPQPVPATCATIKAFSFALTFLYSRYYHLLYAGFTITVYSVCLVHVWLQLH